MFQQHSARRVFSVFFSDLENVCIFSVYTTAYTVRKNYFVNAPSQWETALRWNVSHWLDAYTQWSLNTFWEWGTQFVACCVCYGLVLVDVIYTQQCYFPCTVSKRHRIKVGNMRKFSFTRCNFSPHKHKSHSKYIGGECLQPPQMEVSTPPFP